MGGPFVLTGRPQNNQAVSIRIFANPAMDHLRIESGYNISEVQISDLSGRILLRDKPNAPGINIDVAIFQDGVFMHGAEVEVAYYWEKVILQ